MDEVLKRPTESVDAPRHHEVELTKRGIPVELVESRPLLASLSTTDAVVTVDLDDHTAQAIGCSSVVLTRRYSAARMAILLPHSVLGWPKIMSFQAAERTAISY
jgi:hypothetical protein